MNDKVVDLNEHTPTPDSVIERLGRHRGQIKSITCVITWDDDSVLIAHDLRTLPDLCYDAMALQRYVGNKIEGFDMDDIWPKL